MNERQFVYSYGDPVAEFGAREAVVESRLAAANSRDAGRDVDSFGFAVPVRKTDRKLVGTPRTVLDRATRLAIARMTARDRESLADAKRRLWAESVVSPIRDVMDSAELWPETHWFLWGNKRKVP